MTAHPLDSDDRSARGGGGWSTKVYPTPEVPTDYPVDLPHVYPLTEADIRAARSGNPILRYFDHRHLSGRLADVSALFQLTAYQVALGVPPGPERTVALRKLLEGKDAAVRAALDLAEFESPGVASR